MHAIGFYPVVGDEVIGDCPLCPSCAPPNPPDEWEPIFWDMEADTPTHCCECEALIPHSLTTDGYAYVLDALAEHAHNGRGRPEILGEWAREYLPA